MEITLVKATLDHLKLSTESLSEFRQQFSKLTDDDKQWLADRFAKEYGYTVKR